MEKVSNALKAFVIGAGLLLVAGTILLAALIVLRATGGGPTVRVAAEPGDAELALPAGARVQQVVPDGRRVILLGIDAGGQQFLAIVDAESGERIRLIRIRPER